jgi:hypothetical protein
VAELLHANPSPAGDSVAKGARSQALFREVNEQIRGIADGSDERKRRAGESAP